MKNVLVVSTFLISMLSVSGKYLELNYGVAKNQLPITNKKIEDENPSLILPTNLTNKQAELLSYAYKVAKEDGHTIPEYYQGVIYEESKAGGIKNYKIGGKPGNLYYGIPQIKLGSAKEVLKKYPSLGSFDRDDKIISKLMHDDRWSTRVGSKYLLMMSKGKTPEQGLVAYNKGFSGAKGVNPLTNRYAKKVLHNTKTVVKLLNEKNPNIISL